MSEVYKVDRDVIIIGSGPAGLTASQYAARANLRVAVVEELALGGQALLIAALENYPGSCVSAPKSGFELTQEMHAQAVHFGAEFIMDGALSLKKVDNIFTVTLNSGKTLTSFAVIIATGAKHGTLNVPGEEKLFGAGVSYCASCDGPFFKNKKIFVVGGGDSACDEARLLSRLSSQVIVLHRRDKFRAQKALVDRVMSDPHIEVRFNTQVKEILGEQRVSGLILQNSETGKTYEETGDAVFIYVGAIPQTALVPDLPKDAGGYIITDSAMATSVPGLFSAGDVRSSPFRQVVVAAGEGAVAAHSAAVYVDGIK